MKSFGQRAQKDIDKYQSEIGKNKIDADKLQAQEDLLTQQSKKIKDKSSEQAKALDGLLGSRSKKVDGVVRLCVDDNVLLGRIQKRFTDEGRDDDNPESFKIRLGNYHKQTAPLLPYYAKQGKLSEVDGLAEIQTVAASIASVLDMQKQAKMPWWKRVFGN